MIKTSAMFSAHAIHVLVRNTLIFLVILFISLFIWLSYGINIGTLKLSHYQVDGLYLKLDKKLTLKADKVIIPQRKANPSFDRVDETLESIKYLLTFFTHIELKEIHFKNNILGVYFHDNIIQLSSKDYLIRGNIYREGKILKGSIPMLRLKKYNITMRGEFTYDLHEDILTTEGKFLFKKTAGFFRASKNKNKIAFALSSGEFSDLKSLIALFEIKPSIKPWIVDKIKAKSYQVISLSAKGSIVDKKFKFHADTLKAVALFSGVSISFKDNVPPVLARSFILHYSHDKGLTFDLEHPSYLGKNLDGSAVSIVNLRDDNTTLKLNLKFNTRFDVKVQNLLEAYGINVPVLQEDGKVIASLDAEIGLKSEHKHFAADVNFSKGDVLIDKVRLPVISGSLHYENTSIDLKDIVLKNTVYAGTVNGKIDLMKKKADLLLDADYVKIGSAKERFIDIVKQKVPFILKYKKGVMVDVPKYALTFHTIKKESTLVISDLNKVKAFISKEIPIQEGGHVEIHTKDYDTYDFKGVVKRSSCFLFDKNNTCNTKVPFEGQINKSKLDIYAFDKRVHYNKTKGRINLKNINIDLKKFLEVEKTTSTKKKQKKSAQSMLIIGTQSHLRYDEYSLMTDSYDVEVKPNGDIKAIGSADSDIIKFTKEKDILSLQALRIKDKVLHPLINFSGLQNGRYSLTKRGNPAKVMKGEIIVEGGMMKGFKAYNNTLAFVNTIPALATLHKPGYSNEGFTIISGVVEYRMIGRTKIIFDSIYLKGSSATIVGKGELDLEKNTINVELGILVARELGKVVGSIPLVGYILVGKDKSVTVGLQITGSLDKPDVSVSAAKDILSYPLELIKRTIEAPGYLLSPEK